MAGLVHFVMQNIIVAGLLLAAQYEKWTFAFANDPLALAHIVVVLVAAGENYRRTHKMSRLIGQPSVFLQVFDQSDAAFYASVWLFLLKPPIVVHSDDSGQSRRTQYDEK
jgi:hypothetical protein